MNLSGISTEIYSELGSPSDISTNSIQYWLSGNLGGLNNLINTNFTFTGSGGFEPDVTGSAEVIYKQIYSVYYYGKQLLSSLGAASVDSVLEVDVFGNTVKRINRNELSKTYLQLKKDATMDLSNMINLYKINSAIPIQVAGDDTVTQRPIVTDGFPNRYRY